MTTYVNEVHLGTQELRAAVHVATTSLGQHGHTVLLLQEVNKRLEGVVNVVLDTLGVRSGVILVEVLVHIENQVISRPIWVLHLEEGWSRLGREGLG